MKLEMSFKAFFMWFVFLSLEGAIQAAREEASKV